MAFVTDFSENAKKSIEIFDGFLEKSSTNLLTRLVSYTLALGIVPFLLFVGISYLEYINNENSDIRISKIPLITNERIWKNAADKIQLCISAKDQKKELSGLYCGHALSSYKIISEEWIDKNRRDELIKNKAFEAMGIDVNYQRYLNEAKLNDIVPKRREELILHLMLSRFMEGFLILLIFLIGIYLIYKFNKYLKPKKTIIESS